MILRSSAGLIPKQVVNTSVRYYLQREVDRELVYSGEVGTGFTDELLKSLYSKTQPLEVDESAATSVKKEKGFYWAKPKYSCQVQYVEITDDGDVLLEISVFINSLNRFEPKKLNEKTNKQSFYSRTYRSQSHSRDSQTFGLPSCIIQRRAIQLHY